MAIAFKLPRLPGQDTVNHIKGKKNHIDNLAWASCSEQVQHSYATNENRKSSGPKQSKPVRGRKVGTEEWTTYKNGTDASEQLGIDRANISQACRKGYKAGGYEFEFDEPNEPPLLPGEEWRDVEGTSAAVSSFGRFRSTMGVISTPSPSADGYVYVTINGKKYLLFCITPNKEWSSKKL